MGFHWASHTIRTWVRFAAVATLCSHLGCSSGSFISQDTKQKTGDTRRPTDEGEGVAGYLTDPAALDYKISESDVQVTGPAGAVAASRGAVIELSVCLLKVKASVFSEAAKSSEGLSPSDYVVLASAHPREDGSFSVGANDVGLSGEDLISLSVAGSCDQKTAPVKKGSKEIVFKGLGSNEPFDDPGSAIETEKIADEPAAGVTDFFCDKTVPDCELRGIVSVIRKDTGESVPAVLRAYEECPKAENALDAASVCKFLGTTDLKEKREVFFLEKNFYLIVEAEGMTPWAGLVNGAQLPPEVVMTPL